MTKEDVKYTLRDSEGKEYVIIDTEKVDLQEELNKEIMKQAKEIQRLHNIIKEVREYIENNSYFKDNVVKTMIFKDYSNGILEILDKPISKKSDNDF